MQIDDLNSAVSPLDPTGSVTLEESISIRDLTDHWRSETGIDVTSEFGATNMIHLCRCENSGLRFFSPPIAGSGSFYEKLQQFPWYYRENLWEHRYACSKTTTGDRVIDLGCGTGAFLRLATKAGVRAEGIDFNRAAVELAQTQGLNVACGNWETLADSEAGGFDMVTAFQVLEHLPKPLPLLRSAATLSRTGGKVILSVPNGKGWIARTVNPLDMPPHHVARWSPEAFEFLTTVLPLALEEIKVEPLDRSHTRPYLRSILAPKGWRERARPISVARRIAIRLGAVILTPQILRFRLSGQCLIAVFRKVDR